ncbi:SMC family ATPase [Cryobacterium sp. TmT2-59]|uniref:AAA family ATPase n=1 Tax=Cryobacterium sp. TmT2-59 TaxID=1259264 RepID=UPI00106C0EB5|nr:SMC family ATPase [Cryobacterium sp. TmT2-59]TFC82097.1 SMC family ATPase [Cryobacterium sp. TmT2-59]
MKIKRLRIAGFGPYKNEQVIDFQRFDADGIFLISGKTGAGKSSILDAVCFALYASVPRYEGTESQLRSDHCDPDDLTFVELEFGLNGQNYRIYRTPRYEKNKKRGVGTTMSQPDARLDVFDRVGDSGAADGAADGAGWRSIATRPVDVGHELARILPLKQDQFLQVILLAQNRFQRFLLAKTDDRRAVLRTLFGTARFERVETDLQGRRKLLGDALESVRQRLAGLSGTAARQLQREDVPQNPDRDWFDAARDELGALHRAAAVTADRSAAALAAATAHHQAQGDLRKRQDRRDGALSSLTLLHEREPGVASERGAVQSANRAAKVWPQLLALQAADDARDLALAAERAARQAWQPFQDDPDTAGDSPAPGGAPIPADRVAASTRKSLGTTIEVLLGQLGSLDDVVLAEQRLPGLDGDLADLAARLGRHTAAVYATQEQLDLLPDRLDGIDRELAAAVRTAAREPEARALVQAALAAQTAAEEVRALDADLAAALVADAATARENTEAAVHYQDLGDRRLAGHAAELALQLVDGAPCVVCGSSVHPVPAVGDGEPVTERDLEAARARMALAQAGLDRSHARIGSVTTALALAGIRAGEGSAHELAAVIITAEAALAEAEAAAERAESLGRDKSRLRADLEEAGRSLADLRLARDEAATTLAERRSQRLAIDERVEAHRGDFASVTHRALALRARLDAARTLDEALARSLERDNARKSALNVVHAQLAQEGFTDQAAAVTARLDEAAIATLEAAIRRHDDELAASRAVLAEPEIVGLPDGRTDLEPSRIALAAAADARDEAVAARGSLDERVAVMAGLVADAAAHFDAGAELLATHTRVRELAAAVHGDEPNTKRMRLETYVLAAQLEEIIAAANNRLRTMTGGRYCLEHDDSLQYRGNQSGLGLMIRDAHTGRARPTHSLSGGETFLASLALALGLAEVVSNQAGGIALDTLFVDEGFGSLDSATLETAMSTLDGLRAGGRTIGLISHVDSMKEQIPAKLVITVTDQGYSEIDDGLVPV